MPLHTLTSQQEFLVENMPTFLYKSRCNVAFPASFDQFLSLVDPAVDFLRAVSSCAWIAVWRIPDNLGFVQYTHQSLADI
jgi:hypothetical protein